MVKLISILIDSVIAIHKRQFLEHGLSADSPNSEALVSIINICTLSKQIGRSFAMIENYLSKMTATMSAEN